MEYFSNEISDCECDIAFGGCKISYPSPKGFKCNCEEINWFSCTGHNWECNNLNEYGCNGCWGRECCTGSCGGY